MQEKKCFLNAKFTTLLDLIFVSLREIKFWDFAQNDCALYFLKDLDSEIKSVRNDFDKFGYIKNVWRGRTEYVLTNNFFLQNSGFIVGAFAIYFWLIWTFLSSWIWAGNDPAISDFLVRCFTTKLSDSVIRKIREVQIILQTFFRYFYLFGKCVSNHSLWPWFKDFESFNCLFEKADLIHKILFIVVWVAY